MSVEIVVMNFIEENFSTYTQIRTHALMYRSTRHDAIRPELRPVAIMLCYLKITW